MVMTALERLDSKRAASRRWYRNNRKKSIAVTKRWQKRNRKRLSDRQHVRDQERRRQVIEAYGGKCIRCGIDEWRLLVLDHVNDDGYKLRGKAHPQGGVTFMNWLIEQGYPDIVQLLCHNCNALKAHHREFYDG